MTPHLASWSPATDTAEIRADLRGPYFDRPTVELHLLDLHPGQPPRRSLLARLKASAAAEALRASTAAAFWPAVISSGLVVGVLLGLITRDVAITWQGVVDVTDHGSAR